MPSAILGLILDRAGEVRSPSGSLPSDRAAPAPRRAAPSRCASGPSAALRPHEVLHRHAGDVAAGGAQVRGPQPVGAFAHHVADVVVEADVPRDRAPSESTAGPTPACRRRCRRRCGTSRSCLCLAVERRQLRRRAASARRAAPGSACPSRSGTCPTSSGGCRSLDAAARMSSANGESASAIGGVIADTSMPAFADSRRQTARRSCFDPLRRDVPLATPDRTFRSTPS